MPKSIKTTLYKKNKGQCATLTIHPGDTLVLDAGSGRYETTVTMTATGVVVLEGREEDSGNYFRHLLFSSM